MPSYLVTGSSRGLGLGFIAELLQDPQNYVIATARSSNSTPELSKLLTKHPEKSAFVQLDIADPASIEKAAVDVAKLVPEGLDTLISNAGVNFQPKATLEEADLTLFSSELEVEIVGNTRLIRAFLPLIQKGKGKKLIFVTSGLGSIELAASSPNLNATYSVSRAALNMLVRKWGGALRFQGITTALIHPGWVPSTEIGAGIVDWVEQYAPDMAKVPVAESAKGCVKIFQEVKFEDSNMFWNYDGTKIPW
ncbi:hypothetical protein DL95DRAFT_417848 [Leptodontidium sp. 2 PMI_412]|nr:hypothetical protein DL95DRAFT_417848 [Leptodontidium sp. 2 PMI_412]